MDDRGGHVEKRNLTGLPGKRPCPRASRAYGAAGGGAGADVRRRARGRGTEPRTEETTVL